MPRHGDLDSVVPALEQLSCSNQQMNSQKPREARWEHYE
jgi:hypothetical protein